MRHNPFVAKIPVCQGSHRQPALFVNIYIRITGRPFGADVQMSRLVFRSGAIYHTGRPVYGFGTTIRTFDLHLLQSFHLQYTPITVGLHFQDSFHDSQESCYSGLTPRVGSPDLIRYATQYIGNRLFQKLVFPISPYMKYLQQTRQ